MPRKIGGTKLNIENKPKKKTKPKKNQEVIDVAVKARQAGMSYGQYVAMCYAKGISL